MGCECWIFAESKKSSAPVKFNQCHVYIYGHSIYTIDNRYPRDTFLNLKVLLASIF
jgi:hypothetical protein